MDGMEKRRHMDTFRRAMKGEREAFGREDPQDLPGALYEREISRGWGEECCSCPAME